MTYKIEEAGKTFMFHWVVLMLGALKQVDLSSKIDVCFDREDFNEYQKESFELLSDVINVVPKYLSMDTTPIDQTSRLSRTVVGRPCVEHDTYHFPPRSFFFLV